MLDKMTPEEREQAEIRAQKLIEEDRIAKQKLIDEGTVIAAKFSGTKAPEFCSCCGAPAGTGKFCAYCGQPLQ